MLLTMVANCCSVAEYLGPRRQPNTWMARLRETATVAHMNLSPPISLHMGGVVGKARRAGRPPIVRRAPPRARTSPPNTPGHDSTTMSMPSGMSDLTLKPHEKETCSPGGMVVLVVGAGDGSGPVANSTTCETCESPHWARETCQDAGYEKDTVREWNELAVGSPLTTPTPMPITASTATTNIVIGWRTVRILFTVLAANAGAAWRPCRSQPSRWADLTPRGHQGRRHGCHRAT